MTFPGKLSALAVAGALGLVGCGGNSNDSAPASEPGSTAAGEPTTTGDSTTAAEAPTGSKVEIAGLAYAPAQLEVSAGATVVWTNLDQAQHTVTSSKGDALGSKVLEKGDTYEVELSDPGTLSYFCKIHPFMKATVVVTP